MKPKCVCGCGRRRGVQFHHVVYKQHLRAAAGTDIVRELALISDRRNLVPVGPKCHAAHHNRSMPLRLHMLPDSVFEFAAAVLGPAAAYEYLARRYAGGDRRHDALLAVAA